MEIKEEPDTKNKTQVKRSHTNKKHPKHEPVDDIPPNSVGLQIQRPNVEESQINAE